MRLLRALIALAALLPGAAWGQVINLNPQTFAGTVTFADGGTWGASGISTPSQITSTLASGTAPFVVASTTVVANLNASLLLGATWAAPAAIGTGTPAAITGTTITTNTSLTTPTVASASGALSLSPNNGLLKLLNAPGGTAFNMQNGALGTDLKSTELQIDGSGNFILNFIKDDRSGQTQGYAMLKGTTTNVLGHQWGTSTVAGTAVVGFEILTTGGANHVTVQSATNPTISTSAGSLAITPAIVTASTLTVGTLNSATGLFVCETAGLFSSGVTTCVASDRAVKHDIVALNDPDLLDKVLRKRGVRFTYDEGKGAPGRRIGVIANDWEQDFPELVDMDSQGVRHFDYAATFGLTLEMFRRMQGELADLRTQLANDNRPMRKASAN